MFYEHMLIMFEGFGNYAKASKVSPSQLRTRGNLLQAGWYSDAGTGRGLLIYRGS
jgi:hypothetical protein